MFVARNGNYDLKLFHHKPVRKIVEFEGRKFHIWVDLNEPNPLMDDCLYKKLSEYSTGYSIGNSLFPNLTFEKEPVEIEIIEKKK